jgi:hypothetical protein
MEIEARNMESYYIDVWEDIKNKLWESFYYLDF